MSGSGVVLRLTVVYCGEKVVLSSYLMSRNCVRNLSRRIMTDEHCYGMPVEVFSHDREQQTIDRLKKLNEDSDCPMRSAHIGNIWQMIFSCTRVGW